MRKATWVLVGLGVLAVAEIALLVWVAGEIGVGWTLLVLLALAAVGGFLLRREGGKAWASLREARDDPDAVGRKVSDAALVLVGGLLLMLPGFVTDVLGILCLVPATRPLARRGIQAVLNAATRRYRDQADLLETKLRPDTVVRGEAVEDAQRRPRPDDPTVIRGEVER
ncbi:FxsA family protein [Propioniciclava sinopodophylli]|uniref:FxsA family protein n=1 Tax=Propioniciclava sinopodophylli TaxID=1837344 RepID=A0A4Q9KED7_9ACTN|nr:FxsA family protein [Propioniciclava sinopodophylli]TBT85397.1 FxsA family protein [Propioniciclava sinopodophylli]